jgi:hypothetical protein
LCVEHKMNVDKPTTCSVTCQNAPICSGLYVMPSITTKYCQGLLSSLLYWGFNRDNEWGNMTVLQAIQTILTVLAILILTPDKFYNIGQTMIYQFYRDKWHDNTTTDAPWRWPDVEDKMRWSLLTSGCECSWFINIHCIHWTLFVLPGNTQSKCHNKSNMFTFQTYYHNLLQNSP